MPCCRSVVDRGLGRGRERVVIASVYTTGPALAEVAPSMRQFADYRTRLRRGRCGVPRARRRARRLDQIERAFRPPFLTGWSFFTTPCRSLRVHHARRGHRALEPLVELAPDRILVPLGSATTSITSRPVIAATDWAHARGGSIASRFYEDFYALSRLIRRRHFVARTDHGDAGSRRCCAPAASPRYLSAIDAARRGPASRPSLSLRWAPHAGCSQRPTPAPTSDASSRDRLLCRADTRVRRFCRHQSLRPARVPRLVGRWRAGVARYRAGRDSSERMSFALEPRGNRSR